MNVTQFRADLRAWLDDHDLTPGPDHSLQAQMRQLARVHRALYDAGWMRYGWPVDVGGLGGPALLRAIVGEEVVGRRLAEPGPYSMVEVLAPTMIDYAPPELAAQLVPRLLSGREHWCQGFSEPGSGSDLASLSTRAALAGRLDCQRAEGLDQLCAIRHSVHPAHPHRAGARGTHRIFGRSGHARHHRSPTAHHARRGRILRGLLRRRGDSGQPDARAPGRRLAARDGPAAL
ncbi:acyl-CoA dehydrogenase, N-terminal domain protein [Mycobacterium kansasii]|uniref:Acyl-CoA dehydrogenase, N-terminal domain protein n=1 Tax=Mycobacterium kansasii TaxID=1768 RepID=A0A1V3WUW4_MYCKA|nr:acyl-CoA dehydrogenase, N-terminal domain protein [Mycobacterium kansasii]